MNLDETRVILFGNPQLGTPLMQRERSVGVDLPQKLLVHEDSEGAVHLLYNDPEQMVRSYGVSRAQRNERRL